MAHEVETMAYAGETPWHGLGVEVSHDISTEDMLKKAGLDWQVYKVPLTYEQGGKSMPFEGQYALVRSTDGFALSHCGSAYIPVQNATALEFFRSFVEAGDMELNTAGSLGNGRRIWAMASIRDGFTLAGGDEVEGNLLFTNPHVAGYSQITQFTPIRVVCANTLAMALNGKTAGAYRHPHFTEFDPERAKELLGLAKSNMIHFKSAARQMSKTRYTVDSVTSYFLEVFEPVKFAESGNSTVEFAHLPRLKKALEALETSPGAEMKSAAGTYWGAFNAVTYLADHVLGRTPDTRLTSAWYGEYRLFKQRAYGLALDYARAA